MDVENRRVSSGVVTSKMTSQNLFSPSEYENRTANVQKKMDAGNLDCLILLRPQNIYYLTGYRAAMYASSVSRFHATVLTRDGEPYLITRALEKEAVNHQ